MAESYICHIAKKEKDFKNKNAQALYERSLKTRQ